MGGNEQFQRKNWEGLIEKVSGRLSKWRWLLPQLSYRGRVLVANNLAASILWHKTIVMEPPEEMVSTIQRTIVNFFLEWTTLDSRCSIIPTGAGRGSRTGGCAK